MNEWTLVYEGFDPEKEGLSEALCTLGNGYFATRGAGPLRRMTSTIRGPTAARIQPGQDRNWGPVDRKQRPG